MEENGFVAYVCDQLRPWNPVLARRMFGGQGIFRGGLMFGLIHDDTLYFRADQRNTPDFEAAGTGAFTYRRNGRAVALGYRAVPAEILDEADRLAAWAEKAYAAALGKAAARPRRKR